MKEKNNSNPLQGRLPYDKLVRVTNGKIRPVKPQSPGEVKQQQSGNTK